MSQDAAAFLSYWANARARTLRVLEALAMVAGGTARRLLGMP